MLYEKLDPPMRAMVDTWAERLRGVPWARRSDLLAEAARPFAEQFSGEQAISTYSLVGSAYYYFFIAIIWIAAAIFAVYAKFYKEQDFVRTEEGAAAA